MNNISYIWNPFNDHVILTWSRVKYVSNLLEIDKSVHHMQTKFTILKDINYL